MTPSEAEAKAREITKAHVYDHPGVGEVLLESEILISNLASALLQAVEAEREACAEIAEADDSLMMLQDWGLQNAVSQKAQNIAEDIRARGKDNDARPH